MAIIYTIPDLQFLTENHLCTATTCKVVGVNSRIPEVRAKAGVSLLHVRMETHNYTRYLVHVELFKYMN